MESMSHLRDFSFLSMEDQRREKSEGETVDWALQILYSKERLSQEEQTGSLTKRREKETETEWRTSLSVSMKRWLFYCIL